MIFFSFWSENLTSISNISRVIKIETKRKLSKNKNENQRALGHPDGQKYKSGELTAPLFHPPFIISGSDWLEELPNRKCK